MAHKKCPAPKVWPPKFRPALDPNEVMRQIFALCSHLAKMAGGAPIPHLADASTSLPIPQVLPQPTTPTLPQPSKRALPTTPTMTPPSNRPQESKTQEESIIVKHTTNNNSKGKKNDSKKKNDSEKNKPTENKPANQNKTLLMNQRELTLQKAVHAAGGTTQLLDERDEYEQIRHIVCGVEYQMTWAPEHDHRMALCPWEDYLQMRCHRCRKQMERGKQADSSLCSWRCSEHDVDPTLEVAK